MLYLDNAATSYQKPECFYRAMNKYTHLASVNAGRGGHYFSIMGSSGIEDTSEELCDLFGIDNTQRLGFCQNATMALNMAIGGILKNKGHAIVTQMEHNSVLRPVHSYGNYTIVEADNLGRINPDDIKKAIRSDTSVIICTHASNVCGTIEPISEIGKIAHDFGILFLVDAAQTAGCRPINVKEMNIDLLAFSAHKGLLGPLGVGGLYVREGVLLSPVIFGGTGSFSHLLEQPSQMPDMLHAGTLNTPAIMALGESVRFIKKHSPEKIAAHQCELAFLLIEKLKNMKNVEVYGICDKSQGERNGTVLFNVKGMECGELCEILNDKFKIAARGGWHCAYPAHVALGTEKSGALRASFGFFSNKKSVDTLSDAVYKICKEKRN